MLMYDAIGLFFIGLWMVYVIAILVIHHRIKIKLLPPLPS